MTDTPQSPAIPMWARAIVAGEDDIKSASHMGFTIRARQHAMAVYPDPAAAGKVADSKSMVAYMNAAETYRGVWRPIPRTALVGFLHTMADQSEERREWEDNTVDPEDDAAEEPPPPNPTVCRFIDTPFIPENLRRFCAALPAEDIEWAIAIAPPEARRGVDCRCILMARWGKDGAFAAIVQARPLSSDAYQPVFEESGWAKVSP